MRVNVQACVGCGWFLSQNEVSCSSVRILYFLEMQFLQKCASRKFQRKCGITRLENNRKNGRTEMKAREWDTISSQQCTSCASYQVS